MALIELRGVGRRYQLGAIEVAALDGVSLDIEAGEYVAIMGSSGSGKSTLLNVLGGLDAPTQGHYRFAGRDLADLSAGERAALRRQHFGFVFQRYHLLAHLDAVANVEVPAVYAGVPPGPRRQRAASLLRRLGLGERMAHLPHELSGGQQQRVSIARALMNGGQVVLADEPTGALDSTSGEETMALLAELHRTGQTVIVVTHDAEVAAHARRVITVRDGHVVSDIAADPAAAGKEPAPPQHKEWVLPAGGWWRRTRGTLHEALRAAWAALAGAPLRSALSMLGVAIGIASVVSIVAVSDAGRAKLEADVRSLMSGQMTVVRGNPNAPPGSPSQPFLPHETELLRSLPGVAAAEAQRHRTAAARQATRELNMLISASRPDNLAAMNLVLREGRDLSALDLDQALQVTLIDTLARERLFGPGEPVIGSTLQYDQLLFTVVGVVERSNAALHVGAAVRGLAVVPGTTFDRKIDSRPEVEALDLKLDYRRVPDAVKEDVRRTLAALRGTEDFNVVSLAGEFQTLQQTLQMFSLVFAAVGAIALLVGGIGVMNIMLVSVSERVREIGIRMAVGARTGDVQRQFLLEAVLLCALGGAAGVGFAALLIEAGNAAQRELHVALSWPAVAAALGVSSTVGVIFGWLPARRAAHMSPVEALARD
jgi:macrolide transport system ATP-binding/permease protein